MKFTLLLSLTLVMFSLGCSQSNTKQGSTAQSSGPKQWLVFEGSNGPGKGKHVVLIAGDEEYRSEEAMPQLAKILSQHHGFTCTVLFSQDPEKPGIVDPNHQTNIPNTAALNNADLMIIGTRFRNLPDEQMKPIDDFLKAGKPVIGLRTATHAFKIDEGNYARYGFNYKGEPKEWTNGFGELVLGTTWIAHHGHHKFEATRGIGLGNHEVLNGIGPGDIFGETDVYGVTWRADNDCVPIVMGQVLAGMDKDSPAMGPGPYDTVPNYGKHAGFHKNDPMMPVTWVKSYQLPGGRKGKAFTTTMGAATDLQYEGTRRMIVNGAYFVMGIPVPSQGTKVDLVGDFKPSMYGMLKDPYWDEHIIHVSDFE
ncbi:MAG: ThuA domain-containing protein [Verrucomicrobiae bacterium]|nr:ThuA domain-containing protein [Verrucomicrobiae bacterium]